MIKAGVLGWPIEQSKSPLIHGHWLKKHSINGSYEKRAVAPEKLSTELEILRSNGWAGVNVTVPHKEAIFELADQITDRAFMIGAANTLTFKDDKILADNTDGEGFLNNLLQWAPNWNVGSGPALVIGAGGAARAILYTLITAGVPEVFLVNRTRARAENLANHFGRKVTVANWNDAREISTHVATVINTTSLGMLGQEPLDFSCEGLRTDTLVTDIVYNPLETELLRSAKANGNPTVDGLGMLLHQAVPGFENWFDIRPSVDADLRTLILDAL